MTILAKMFDSDNPVEQIAKLEAFKSAMAGSLAEADSGQTAFSGNGEIGARTIKKGMRANPRKAIANLDAVIEKSIAGDNGAAIGADLAAFRASFVADLQKDWTPTNPVGGTGLTPYDLEGPAKVLVPRDTPLRNTVPRERGQGNARKFKRIDSFSNAGIPGGSATLSPFFNSLTQTSTWGPTNNITLARPQKIAYTGSDWTNSYVELGFSDSVDWIAQFQGLGFDDLRALSHTALLYSHLLGEERAMLYGRGATGGGYAGTVAAPSGITTATATTGGTIPALTSYQIYVTANTGFGESLPSTVAAQATTGAASTITITIGTEPAGAINYNVYVGSVVGIGTAHYQGTFAGNVITLTSYNSTSAVGAGTDTSFAASAYDGYLTVQSDTTKSGYFKRQNAAFSTTNPGSEFDLALQTMYVNNAADPDEIWLTGAMRAEFGQLLRVGGANGAASGYRTNLQTGDGSVTMGTSVTGYVNQNTGKVLDLRTHRFMPTGAALIRSTSVPVPDSHVAAPVVAVNVQEYMAIDWPTIQLTYDTSTYQIGTLIHYAPAWSGLIVGVL